MSRLKDQYLNEIVPAMVEKFGYKNIMEVPKIDKIVVNMGVGEAKDNAKLLESAVKDMACLYPDVLWQNAINEDVMVKTDPNLLRQILINIVKNAVEAGAKTMGLECEATRDGKVLLYISNDGEMIPAEARSSIFVPFFTTKRKGNGIGLSLSRRLLAIQGGMMSLLDEPRSGFHTTFLLEFPC